MKTGRSVGLRGCGRRLVRTNYDDPHAWNVLMRPTILYANFKNHFSKERKKNNIDKNLFLYMPGPLQPVPSSQA